MTDSNVTQLLDRFARGDDSAREELFQIVYQDLKRLSQKALAGRQNRTLQPTALVHEAYLRLVKQEQDYKNRSHFFSIAGLLIRRILVDDARARMTRKRGAGEEAVPLSETLIGVEDEWVDVLDLHASLEKLEAADPQAARVVEMRYFAGLGNEDVAEVLGVSLRSVVRLWAFAKAFLYQELEKGEPHE